MAHPAHTRRPAIGSTPSLGQAEALRALARIDHRRIGVTAAQVAQALRTSSRRPSTSSVTTALNAIGSTLVTAASGTYRLTRAGQKAAFRQRPRPIGAFNAY